MSEWAAKRFYKTASVEAEDAGFSVRLDGRPIRTPSRHALTLPTERMAQRIAEEWLAQEEKIDPQSMPWTRSANSAIDKVSAQRSEIEAHLIEYAGTDLLCYRAESPAALAERQANAWGPVLDWAADRFNARFQITSGVMPVLQNAEVTTNLAHYMQPMSDFQLTGFYDLVTLSGSYVLGVASAESLHSADHVWQLSRIDEDWQEEQWGVDVEASKAAQLKKDAFLHAWEFFVSA